MRTGAIFARGSCRALKWMALLGVVFALGAGPVAAQTVEITSIKLVDGDPMEGSEAIAEVTFKVTAGATPVPLSAATVDLQARSNANFRSPESGMADQNDFSGLAYGAGNFTSFTVDEIGALTAGSSRSHTGRYTFTINHDVDAEDDDFMLAAKVTWQSVVDPLSGVKNSRDILGGLGRPYRIDDNEDQTYELEVRRLAGKVKSITEEGDTGTHNYLPVGTSQIALVFDPTRTHEDTVPQFTLELEDYNPGGAFEFGSTIEDKKAGQTMGASSMANNPNLPVGHIKALHDRDREDGEITLNLWAGAAGDAEIVHSITVDVMDIHKLPEIMAEAFVLDGDGNRLPADEQPEPMDGVHSIMEGKSVEIDLTAVYKDAQGMAIEGQMAKEDLTVTLEPVGSGRGIANAQDYDLSISSVMIPEGESTETVTVMMAEDQDVGMEMLSFAAKVAGEAANGTEIETSDGAVVSIKITDATMRSVWAKDGTYPADNPDTGAEEAIDAALGATPMIVDDVAQITVADLFMAAGGFTLTYAVSVQGSAVTAVYNQDTDLVTVTAVDDGDAHVTVTATAISTMSNFTPSQEFANAAQITFPVKVVLADLVVEVAPDDVMDDGATMVMEGSSTMITATANRAVTEDRMIMLSVVGDEDAYMVADSITIPSGMMSASVELMASEDDDYMNETLTVFATGPGIDGSIQFEIMVTDNDDAPVDMPLITAKSQDEVDAAVEAAINEVRDAAGLWYAKPLGDNSNRARVALKELFMLAEGVTTLVGGADSSDRDDVARTWVSDADGDLERAYVGIHPNGPGIATLEVRASASDAEGETDSAMVSFDVTVDEAPLDTLVVTVTADPMEVEEGKTSTITATVADRMVDARDGDVMVSLAVVGDATLDSDSITIAAGAMSGTATLTVTDDDEHEMGETVSVVYSGSGISGSQTLELTVADNDAAPVVDPTVSAKAGAEGMITAAIAAVAGDGDWMVGGMAATVDMSTLFDVDEGATVAYAGDSSNQEVVRSMSSGKDLTLTPMGAGSATITVTATDAASSNVATVTANVTVVLQTLIVEVEAESSEVMEGGSTMITAKANRNVTEDTMVSLTVTGDTGAVSVPAMITIAMGSDMGSATLAANQDDDADNTSVTLVAAGAGIATPISIDITVIDDDPTVSARSAAEVAAAFTAATAAAGGMSGWLQGDDAAEIELSALFTTIGRPTLEYTAESSAEEMVTASISGATLMLTPVKTGSATITVTATDTSGDMDHATVTQMVTVGVLPLSVMLTPTTVTLAEGGEGVNITATANKMVDANVEVMLMRDGASVAGEGDYSLDPPLITIMMGEATGSTMLTATDDYDVEGMESLTLHGKVGDMAAGSVMVTIEDNDMDTNYTLSGPTDMNLVEGMSYDLTATANQAVRADTEVKIMRDRASSTAGVGDYSVESIMIKAGEMSGTTRLMITEDNTGDGGSGSPETLALYGTVDGLEIGNLGPYNLWDAAVPALPVIAQLLLAAFLAVGGYRRYLRR